MSDGVCRCGVENDGEYCRVHYTHYQPHGSKEPIVVNIEKVVGAVFKDAENQRYNSPWGDGGASDLMEQIKWYRYGQLGAIPQEWQTYADQVIKETDPDYEQYILLKKKFGDR